MSDGGDHDRLLDELIESGIFEQSQDGGLVPTGSFQAKREEHRTEVAELDDDELDDIRSAYATEDVPGPSTVGVDVLGDARAIHQTTASLDRERSLLAALALERIEESESAGGVPDGFVPLEGEEVDGFMRNHPAAIVYCWREDCPPCDGARECLEELLAEGVITESVSLAAVYGPDSPELLREEYDVGVAPTTLFCVDGRIDSRLVGNPGYEAFRTEVEIITDAID